MKITGVDVFTVSLPLFRSFSVAFGALPFDHVMVRLRSDSGQSGWGDTGHLLTAYSGESVRAPSAAPNFSLACSLVATRWNWAS